MICRDISDALENDRFTPYSVPCQVEISLRVFVFVDGAHGSSDVVARGDASDAGDTVSGRFRELLGTVSAGNRGSGRREGGVTRSAIGS